MENYINDENTTVAATGIPQVDRLEKAKAFISRHGIKIALGVGYIGLGVVCVQQRRTIAMKNTQIELQGLRIRNLAYLCEEKDNWFKKLMSDALKHGSSFAGKCMADRREFLNGR